MIVYPERPRASYCEFVCTCDRVVRFPATPPVIASMWYLIPSTLQRIPQEALETHDATPLTEDDYLDFVLELGKLP